MAVKPKANTQPIYTKEIFTRRAKLTNQVVPLTPIPNVAPGLLNATPVKMGTAGECGALVWNFQADIGLNGASITSLTCFISLYTRREGDTEISPRGAYTLTNSYSYGASGSRILTTELPTILPIQQRGMHFEANEEVFVGLYANSFVQPVMVYLIGGHY